MAQATCRTAHFRAFHGIRPPRPGHCRVAVGSLAPRPGPVRPASRPASRTWFGYAAFRNSAGVLSPTRLSRALGVRAPRFGSGSSSAGAGAGKTPLYAVVTALAFKRFDEETDTGVTREERMLDFSLKELDDGPPDNLFARIIYYLDKYVYEPVRTFLRFWFLTAVFGPVLLSMPLTLVGYREPPHGERSGALLWYRYLRWSMEKAGASFVKLGQWAASRVDIFPAGLCDELGKLHSSNSPHRFKYTKKAVEAAFGRGIDQVFEEFQRKPLGVGAMGQVYKARLSPKYNVTEDSAESDADGDAQWVAVKVLHPRIVQNVSRDLRIMMLIARIINAVPTMEWLSLPGEVTTFGVMMKSQLDLRIEAENLRIFRHNFKDNPNVTFPQPYPRYTTRNVLVEQLVTGVSMEKILQYCTHDTLDREIGSVGVDVFLKMLLIDNFIHSDLHPGNIFVRFSHLSPPDFDSAQAESTSAALNNARDRDEWNRTWDKLKDEGYRPQLSFIDAGLVTELNPQNRQNFFDLFKAIAGFDGYAAGELMVARSRTPETAVDAEVFALRTQRLVDQVKRRTFALGNVSIGDLLTNMMDMVRRHHVRMESDFITVVLSILLLEGIGRQLNPDLDIFKSSLPILRQVSLSQKASFGKTSKEDALQMAKIWLALELRQFINASVQDIHRCVKYDKLSPNQ